MPDFDELGRFTPGAEQREPEPQLEVTASLSVVEAVRTAERAGQAALCGLHDEPLPDALELALDRRVEVNLERTGGHPVASVAADDPDVVALEAPYRHRPATDSAADIEQLPSGPARPHHP